MFPTVHAPRFRYRGPGEPEKLNLFRNQLLYDMARLDAHVHAQEGAIDAAYIAYREGQGSLPGGVAFLEVSPVPTGELCRRLDGAVRLARALVASLH